jgi:hypothetical protein
MTILSIFFLVATGWIVLNGIGLLFFFIAEVWSEWPNIVREREHRLHILHMARKRMAEESKRDEELPGPAARRQNIRLLSELQEDGQTLSDMDKGQ